MVPQERIGPLVLVFCAVCLTVTGELFLKGGMNRVGLVTLQTLTVSFARILRTPQIWTGFGFIGCGAVLWLAALSRVPLSWAYPILSLGYVLVLIFSRIVLGEAVSPLRWAGTVIILLGVALVFRS